MSSTFAGVLLSLVAVLCLCAAVEPGREASYKKASAPKRNHLLLEFDIPEVPDTSIRDFPHEKGCHKFYHTYEDSGLSLETCPRGTIFDYVSHRCLPREFAKCWSHHFNKEHTARHSGDHHDRRRKDKRHFECPFVWRRYPDVEDCGGFFLCLPGVAAVHKRCPLDAPRFDNVDRKCAAADHSICADQSDVPDKAYVCPSTWGYFAFPGDCAKYYECLGTSPGLSTCPRGTLFDAGLRECLPGGSVRCGERPIRGVTPTPSSTHPSIAAATMTEESISDDTGRFVTSQSSETASTSRAATMTEKGTSDVSGSVMTSPTEIATTQSETRDVFSGATADENGISENTRLKN